MSRASQARQSYPVPVLGESPDEPEAHAVAVVVAGCGIGPAGTREAVVQVVYC